MIQRYDGDVLLSDLEALAAPQRRAFAAACAEALLRHFGSAWAASESAGSTECEQVVAFCWRAVERGAGDPESSEIVDLFLTGLEEILSEDEEGDLGVMEHVIAGAYYALKCSREGDSGNAELVAKNLYEAADYVALADPEIDMASPNAGSAIIASEVVQKTLAVIAGIRDLVIARTFQGSDQSVEISQVRGFARQGLDG
ncbi:hypothetical protein RCR19_43045 (plasmid) [Streptomyces sp. WAC07094]|uniref:hypothetical protein n=1 Tax=Streptomyces sp. WAC07094 TaxID=3072183 RepID=UPI002E985702|nr:hypothetical protein [Streptomyces sp. WAC07094]